MKPGLTALTLSVSLTATACLGGNTPEEYCQTVADQKAEILATLEDRQDLQQELFDAGDGFGAGLVTIAGTGEALLSLQSYFDALAAKAPPEIEAEAETVSELTSSMVENLKSGDAASILAGSLIDGFRLNRPLSAMNAYTIETCGESV